MNIMHARLFRLLKMSKFCRKIPELIKIKFSFALVLWGVLLAGTVFKGNAQDFSSSLQEAQPEQNNQSPSPVKDPDQQTQNDLSMTDAENNRHASSAVEAGLSQEPAQDNVTESAAQRPADDRNVTANNQDSGNTDPVNGIKNSSCQACEQSTQEALESLHEEMRKVREQEQRLQMLERKLEENTQSVDQPDPAIQTGQADNNVKADSNFAENLPNENLPVEDEHGNRFDKNIAGFAESIIKDSIALKEKTQAPFAFPPQDQQGKFSSNP